jgi:hypothetical protein
MIRNSFFVAFMVALIVWNVWEARPSWWVGIAVACWIALLAIYRFRHRTR